MYRLNYINQYFLTTISMKYTIKYTKEADGICARAYSEEIYAGFGSGETIEEARRNVIERLQPTEDLGSEEIEVPEETIPAPDERQAEIESANPSLTSNPFSL